ncbi:NEDD4 family-interacting protein 2 [Tupaia chinensis]|uniref:NEDD4 family-interacting protein 2 n=1 Tax=Tupaia chinensis TaxID=246437 RepID=L8Y4U8_TUPCH|nr:NEDD4 family-interacting protein 2 [Tupaia chinensis]
MGRRRTQRACAVVPSMPSSARGAPEPLHGAVTDAEVSAAAAGATGSEEVRPDDRGGRNRGGKGAAEKTPSLGVAERAEHRGDSPAQKPDPEPGRMDLHQPGTGRYQVVSSRLPAPPGPWRCLGVQGPREFLSSGCSRGDLLAFFF